MLLQRVVGGSMRVWQLKAFITVARELHFGRAAEKLNVTQQTISAAISRLEEEIGMKLFVRSTRSVKMTEAASCLLANIDSGIALIESGIDAARKTDVMDYSEIRVGYTLGTLFTSPLTILRKFHDDNIGTQIALFERSTSSLLRMLQTGDIDAAFTYPLGEIEGVDYDVLRSDPLMVVMPRGHSLEAHDVLDRGHLANERMIDYRLDRSQEQDEESIISLMRTLGIDLRSGYTAESGVAAIGTVAMGLGFTLSIERVARHWDDVISMRSFEGIKITQVLATRADETSVFVERLRDCARHFQQIG